MKKGQRVVCLVQFIRRDVDPPDMICPIQNEIYTIRGIIAFDNEVSLYLEGIVNQVWTYPRGPRMEVAFNVLFFRLVDEMFGEEVAAKLEKEFIEKLEPISI
jgi:hypothetical protein